MKFHFPQTLYCIDSRKTKLQQVASKHTDNNLSRQTIFFTLTGQSKAMTGIIFNLKNKKKNYKFVVKNAYNKLHYHNTC